MKRLEVLSLISAFAGLAAMLQPRVPSTNPVQLEPVETWDQFVTRDNAAHEKPGWFESISPTANAWFFPRARPENPDWSTVRIETLL